VSAPVVWTEEHDGAFIARVWWGVERYADLVVTPYVGEGWCVKVDVPSAPPARMPLAPRMCTGASDLPSAAVARTLAERLVAAAMKVMP
jgi:hypothetical protein